MIYKTKADLLGRLWKSRSDVRLIDRMVHRGEVKKVAEWYEVNENFFIKWINEYDKNMIQNDKAVNNNDKSMTLPEENLLDHLRFFYEMDLRRKSAMEEVIKMFANKYQDLWREEAEKKALWIMKFIPNSLEDEEIEYVGGILGGAGYLGTAI